MVEPRLHRGALASVHIVASLHCGAQAELIAFVARSVQVWQLLPLGQMCPHADANVLQVPAWHVTAAVPPDGMRDPSSAPSLPSKHPQPG